MLKKNLIIIHGLDSKRVMFEPLMGYLHKDFQCHYFHYSLSCTVPRVVTLLHEFIRHIGSFYCVTYSFGSVIVRNYAAQYGANNIERVVMAVPVNQGSRLLRQIMERRFGKRMFGVLGKDFIEHEKEYLPQQPPFEVGVIAGTKPVTSHSRAVNKYVSRFFDTAQSDGKVKLEETTLPFMKDFITIQENHLGVLTNSHFFELTKTFLLSGSFRDNSR